MSRQFPSHDRVRALLRERIDVCKRGVGGIIGVIEPLDEFTIAYGRSAHGASAEIAADTIFGLGCVSNVLTGLLCADMLERGEIRLSDRLADFLPGDVPGVGRNGVAITLEHLVAHRAGLPPATFELDPTAPIDRFYDFVREYVPHRDVGLYHQYSVVGFALLGLALAHRAGAPLATLIRERVCAPLGMVDTSVEVPPAAASRLAGGHDAGLVPVPPPAVPVTAVGHDFHSTASDVMRLLSACVGKRVTPLEAAIRRTRSMRWTGAPGMADVALSWKVGTVNGVELFTLDGYTTGHRVFVGVAPALGRAVVAMVNGLAPVGLTDVGRHLLNADCPLLPREYALLRPARSAPPSPAAAPSHRLDSYIGLYQLTPRIHAEVVRNDAGLQLRGGRDGDTSPIVPMGGDEFWLPASGMRLDCVVRFERAGERVVALIVEDPAGTRRLMRVDDRSARVWHGRSASEAGATALDQYVGSYQFGAYVLDVRRAGQALCAVWSWAGQSALQGALVMQGSSTPLPLVHERDHRFFVDADETVNVTDVSLTFESDGRSPAGAVLCQIEQQVERGARIPAMIA